MAPPLNDNFADAEDLIGSLGYIEGTLAESTAEGPYQSEFSQEVWYKHTPDFDGEVMVAFLPHYQTQASILPLYLATFTDSGAEIANELFPEGYFGAPMVVYEGVAGVTVYIVAAGPPTTTHYMVQWQSPSGPPAPSYAVAQGSAAFADAPEISVVSADIHESEPQLVNEWNPENSDNIPNYAGVPSSIGVWWKYTPVDSGTLVVSLIRTTLEDGNPPTSDEPHTIVHVFSGDSWGDLELVGYNYDAFQPDNWLSELSVSVTGLSTYYVRAGLTSLSYSAVLALDVQGPLSFSPSTESPVSQIVEVSWENEGRNFLAEFDVSWLNEAQSPPWDEPAGAIAVINPDGEWPAVPPLELSNALLTFSGTVVPGEWAGTDYSTHYNHRSAWIKYRPSTNGSFTFRVESEVNTPSGPNISVWWYMGPSHPQSVYDLTQRPVWNNELGSGSYWWQEFTVPVVADQLYYLKIASSDDEVFTYRVTVDGPPNAPYVSPVSKSVQVEWSNLTSVVGKEHQILWEIESDRQFVTKTQQVSWTFGGTFLTVPFNTVSYVKAYSPTLIVADVVLVSPTTISVSTGTDVAVLLPTRRPVFVVTVATEDTFAVVEVQYDTSPLFTNPTTLEAQVSSALSSSTVSLRATEALTDGATYYWRARVYNHLDATPWSGTSKSFTLSVLDGDALVSGTWNVTDAIIPAPHLWFLHPPRAHQGEQVTAYGTGFSSDPEVFVGEVPALGVELEVVPATSEGYTDERVIDTDLGEANVYHQEVRFTVPDTPPPGHQVFVTGD